MCAVTPMMAAKDDFPNVTDAIHVLTLLFTLTRSRFCFSSSCALAHTLFLLAFRFVCCSCFSFSCSYVLASVDLDRSVQAVGDANREHSRADMKDSSGLCNPRYGYKCDVCQIESQIRSQTAQTSSQSYTYASQTFASFSLSFEQLAQ
jgi:hypothetical protein